MKTFSMSEERLNSIISHLQLQCAKMANYIADVELGLLYETPMPIGEVLEHLKNPNYLQAFLEVDMVKNGLAPVKMLHEIKLETIDIPELDLSEFSMEELETIKKMYMEYITP